MAERLGKTELAFARGLHFAAELGRHGLHAVADAEYRYARLQQLRRRARGFAFGRGLRAAGKDDALNRAALNSVFVGSGSGVERGNLAIHPGFARAAGDELRVLRAEIDDEDTLGVNVAHWLRLELTRLRTIDDSSGLPW